MRRETNHLMKANFRTPSYYLLPLVVCAIALSGILAPRPLSGQENFPSPQNPELPEFPLAKQVDSLLKLIDNNKLQEAQNWINTLEPQLDKPVADSVRAQYTKAKALFYFQQRNIRKSIPLYEKAKSLAEATGDTNLLISVLSGYANALSIKGEYRQALAIQTRLLKLIGPHNEDLKYHGILMNEAHNYQNIGYFDSALTSLVKARNYFDSTGQMRELGISLNNLGELFREYLQDTSKAIEHYHQAIDSYRKVNNRHGLSQTFHNLAITYLDLGKIDSAEYYEDKSIQLKKRNGITGAMAPNYFARGQIYQRQGQFKKAEKAFLQTLSLAKKNQIKEGDYFVNSALGELYQKISRLEEAHTALQSALQAAEELNTPTYQAQAHNSLYEFYKKTGSDSLALLHLEKARVLEDSLNQESAKEELNAQRARYENQLTSAENKVLKKEQILQNKELENRNLLLLLTLVILALLILGTVFLVRALGQRNFALRKLKESEQELEKQLDLTRQNEEELKETNELKNKILSVLGHDLRSPLASISGLLGTLSAQEITREELQTLAGYLKEETDVSLRTLQDILQWARLQMNERRIQFEKIDLQKKLEDIQCIYQPNIRAKNLQTKIHCEELPFLKADPIQLQSMVGNLLSNAIKFSPEKEEIEISSHLTNGQPTINIRDHGQGMPAAVLEKLNGEGKISSNLGTKGEKGSGIGLRIVQDFIRSHQGELRFENHPQGGTIAQLIFPKDLIVDTSDS